MDPVSSECIHCRAHVGLFDINKLNPVLLWFLNIIQMCVFPLGTKTGMIGLEKYPATSKKGPQTVKSGQQKTHVHHLSRPFQSLTCTLSSYLGSSKPTLEEVHSWGQSFDKLMGCPAGRNSFRQFLRTEFSEENMLFWLACDEFCKETNKSAIEEKARVIYEDYISILSPKEVRPLSMILFAALKHYSPLTILMSVHFNFSCQVIWNKWLSLLLNCFFVFCFFLGE